MKRALLIGLASLAFLFSLMRQRVTSQSQSRANKPSLELTLWYWRQPFDLTKQQLDQLQRAGVRRLFVNAGHLDTAAVHAKQSWLTSGRPLKVWLTFWMRREFIAKFGKLQPRETGERLAELITAGVARARAHSVEVAGVQLDFDVPTRLLDNYAELLRGVRAKLPRGTGLAITTLPTYLSSPSFSRVVREVDFFVPQFYETARPATGGDLRTIARPGELEKWMQQADGFGMPFLAGLPSYGVGMVFAAEGKLVALQSDLSPLPLFNMAGMKRARAFASDENGQPAASPEKWSGEEFLDFVAADDVTIELRGVPRGSHLVFNLPSAHGMRSLLSAVRSARAKNCRGFSVFRYPQSDEMLALPVEAVTEAFHDRSAKPQLSMQWNAISHRLQVTNVGHAATRLGDDAVIVELELDAAGFMGIERGDFDTVATFDDNASYQRCSPRRARVARWAKRWLQSGETARLGPVRWLNKSAKATGHWRARLAGGFEATHGEFELK